MKKRKKAAKKQEEPRSTTMTLVLTPSRLDIATRIMAGFAAHEGRVVTQENIAKLAVQWADALLAEDENSLWERLDVFPPNETKA